MLRGPAGRLARELRETPALVPGALAVGVVVTWSVLDGGYVVTRWLPGALFVLGLLAALVLAMPGRLLPPSRPIVAALALLAAFTAWSFVSIAWAQLESDAWDGANRTLLYLLLFALFALRPWRTPAAATVLGGYSLAIAAVGVVELIRTSVADDPIESFIAGRLALPIAYPNATCALLLLAFWPAAFLAGRRETPLLLRPLFLAAAGALAEIAVLSQSRGSLVAVPLAAAVWLAIVPGRLRALLVLVPVAAAVAATARPLLDVYSAIVAGEEVTSTVVRARDVVLVSVLALAAYGLAFALVDRRLRVPARAARAAGRAVAALGAVAAAVAVLLLALNVGDPAGRAADAWDRFKAGQYVQDPDTPHFTSGLGSGRYDIWRVAVGEIRDHPLAGVGADNFAVDYLRERRTVEEPRYPHSVELRTLAQTGAVGTALLLGFIVAAGWAVLRALRRGDELARGTAAAAAMVFVYWFVHGSVDWFWELPALGGAAFAFLGLAMQVEGPAATRAGGRRPRAATAAAIVLGIVAALSLGLPWLSAQETEAAAKGWVADPDAAFDRLDRARRLNPLSDQPDVIGGIIAGRMRDDRRQRAAFTRALERNPYNWYPMVELAALEGRAGRTARALRWLRRAQALNPLEPSVDLVRTRIRERRPMSSVELQRLFVSRADLLTGKTQG